MISPIIVNASLFMAVLCMVIIVIDILFGNNQKMMVMNFVYPITALYAGPLALWVYYTIGRKSTKKTMEKKESQRNDDEEKQKPFWQSVVVGALHCGSGCTLGDLIAESFLFFIPLTLFGMKLYGAWAIDYVLAFSIGIAFQYYAIKPMRDISVKEGIKAALKADTLSLTSWQIGMYGWMAIATFLIFGHELKANTTIFWFMMQIAMMFGFLTAYPMNWFLIKNKIKEKM